MRKLDASGKPVAATFNIYEGNATSGTPFATVTTTDTGEGYVTVNKTFPAGTYTVVETKLGEHTLTPAELSNFLLLNENKTFTFGETEDEKLLELKNPGTGSLTITKKNDAGEPMAGVQFTLNFTAFTKDNLNAAPAASAVTFDVEDQTGVAIDANDLITDENGTITLEGLVPGWYKLTEVEGEKNANHVLADAQVFNVGDGSFGGDAEVTVNFVNDRYGLLTIEKSFTDAAQWPSSGVTFEVYDGSEKVTDVTLTADAPSQTIQLAPDKTYTVKEVTEGDWFAKYTVTGSSDADDNVTDKWLNEEQSDGAAVTIKTDPNADTAAVVAFENVDRLAGLAISKVDDAGNAVTEEVEFQLYYVDANGSELYYNASNGSWGEQSNATTIEVTGGSGELENIKLPYDVITGTDSEPEFFLTETKTPDAYYPAEDTPVALSATAPTPTNVEIVNEAGIQITLTKYGRLPDYATDADVLSGATFALYEYSVVEDELAYTLVETQTTGPDGQITFSNLRKLDETKGERYYIVETVTPETHVADSTQVYVGSNKVEPTDVDGQKYFLVAVDETVANVKAYNMPKGQIVILKRDLMDLNALVKGAIFTVTDANGDGYTVRPTGGTDTVQSDALELPGYTYDAATGSYVDGSGVHYTVAMTDVVLAPGTYTVTESKVPDKYLATTVLVDGVKWETTKTVTVGENGGVAVATFANVPNPTHLGLEMTKTASPAKVASLQQPDGQDITYTLSGFNELTLPVNSAVLTDQNIQFLAGSTEVDVDWELTGTMTIGQATFNRENPLFDGGETILMQAKVSFLVNGEWGATTTPYTVATSAAQVPVPDGAQGFKIEYVNGGGGKIHAGFIPGDVTFTLHASQENDASVVPVDQIFNQASFVVTYDFAEIGSTGTAEARVEETADATAEVSSALTLPRAKITKDSEVTWNGEQPSGIEDTIARGGDTITYTITLETTENGSDDGNAWGVTDPVIGDVIPDGLTIDLENSKWETTGRLTSEAGIAVNGNAVTLATKGQLMQGEKLTLTLACTVQDVAVIVAPDGFDNTAYVYSPYKVAKHTDNEHGISFADQQGNPAGTAVPSELAQAEYGLKAEKHNGITSRSGLFIQKFVSVGGETAGSEGYLEVQPDGTINYTVEVVNNSSSDINHLWIADTLPHAGDGDSAWGPALTTDVTVSGTGTVYYATGHMSEDGLFSTIDKTNYTSSSLSTTRDDASDAFLVFVETLAKGARVTLTYTCKAPSEAEAAASDRIYYYMAVNSASFMYDDRPVTQNESNNTLVTVVPQPVALGDTVWIDKNANGIQDDGDGLTPPDVSLTLTTYVEDSATSQTITVSGGDYLFEDRNPATPQNSGAKYGSNGDIDYTSLVGNGTRHTYRLSATAPTGYVITEQYQPGGSVLTVDDENNAARADDSNFDPTTGQTERFYLKTGANDLTYDLGLVRMRNLTIEKVGDNGLKVPNVSFDIYGPFYGNDFDVTGANVEKRTISTGANGEDAVFTSDETDYLNAYAYYVVVESLPEDSHYTTDKFEVASGEGTQVSTTTPVAGLDGAKYFVLKPYEGPNMTGAVQDKVEVTNEYVAEGKLTIKGQKIVEGAADGTDLSGYTFTLTSQADSLTPTYDEEATSNEDGVFTFPQLTFDYDDVLETGENTPYVYELREIAGSEKGIVYDNRVYTIEVNFADTDGDGKLTTYVKILDEEGNTLATVNDATGNCIVPLDKITFTNRFTGGLSVQKIVAGDDADTDKTFDFELKLTDEEGNALTNASFTHSPASIAITESESEPGVYTFSLGHEDVLTISGLTDGIRYEVTETSGAQEGYEATIQGNASGEIAWKQSPEVVFTNTREVGGLTVKKVTDGNVDDKDVLFTFTVTLKHDTLPLNNTYGDVTFSPVTEGDTHEVQATFTLKHDETKVLTGIPAGTEYTVAEQDYTAEGYVTNVLTNNATGTIAKDGDSTVEFRNTRNVGNLTVSKTVTGTGKDENKGFSFTVTFTAPQGMNLVGKWTKGEQSGAINVPVEMPDAQTGEQPRATLTQTFTLKHGEQIDFTDLPAGTTYTVSEDDYTAEGYVTNVTGTQSGSIAADAPATVAYANERNTGNLTVTKVVTGSGSDSPNANTSFAITVTLTAPTGMDLVGSYTSDDEEAPSGNINEAVPQPNEENGEQARANWKHTFTLKAGEAVTFTGLPEDTDYTVEEEDISIVNGFEEPAYTNASGTIAACEEAEAGIIATVTNTILAGDITISKEVLGSGAQLTKPFTFKLTLINDDGVKVDNTYEATGAQSEVTVSDGEATFTLIDGQSLTIKGIPVGTRYTVTEDDPDSELQGYLETGYVTEVNGENGATYDGGTLTEAGDTIAFTNTRDVGELSIEKKVTGALGEMGKAFAFTLELTPSGNGIGVDGTYDATLYTAGQETSTTVTVANGIANFNLTHDQRLVIHEIPAGATYAVSEESYALEGYQTSASSDTGTIPATGSMPVATFTNTRNGGSLRIVKNFAGNAAIPGDTFAFTIRLGRLDGVNVDGTYDALRNGVAEPITFTGGVATVWLGSGDTFEILGILSGTDYAVSEDIPVDSGYIGRGENETGAIPIDTAAQVTFTNARYTGNLTVSKTVAGNAAETDRSFRFTIFLRNPDGSNANGTYPMTGRSAFITFVNGYASIRLAAGETATIHGILSGSYYSVSEDDANTDGYVTTASGATGTIPAIASAQASFLNTRDVGTEETTTSRTVYKVWNDADNADGLRPTELVVYLLADGVSIDAATLSEANGWSARFDNLPVYNADGSAIEYQVVEAYTAEYYVRYQYAAAVINIINSHNPEDFVPDEPRDPNLLTLIEDYMVPLGGNVNMNEGDCFN